MQAMQAMQKRETRLSVRQPNQTNHVCDTRQWLCRLVRPRPLHTLAQIRVKELPHTFDKREIRKLHSMVPLSWSSVAYYKKVLVPLLQQHKVSLHLQPSPHFATSHANDIPTDTANRAALSFIPPIPTPVCLYACIPVCLYADRLHPRVRLTARQQQSACAFRASETAL